MDQELKNKLHNDIDWKVRQKAAWFLGRLNSNWALSTLVGGLGDPDPDVKVAILKAIGKINSNKGINEILANHCHLAKWPQVREETAKTIAQLPGFEGVETLLFLSEDIQWEVRNAAIEALEKKLLPPAKEKIKYYIRMIGTKNEAVRKLGEDCLSQLGQDALIACSNSMGIPSIMVRRSLISCMKNTGSKGICEPAMKYINDRDPQVRRLALECMEYCLKDDGERIIELLFDDNGPIRHKAAELLMKMDNNIIPKLKEAIKGQKKPIYRELVRVIGKIRAENKDKYPFITDALIGFLSHPSYFVRQEAIEQIVAIQDFPDERLIEIVDNSPIKKLKKSAKDLSNISNIQEYEKKERAKEREYNEKAWSCASAINILGNKKNLDAIGPIARSLKNKDSKIAIEAVVALGKFENSKVKVVLEKVLKQSDMMPWVKEYALRSLAMLKGDGKEFAIEYLDSSYPQIRREGVRLMAINPPNEAISALKKRLGDQTWSVRREASFALDNINFPGVHGNRSK